MSSPSAFERLRQVHTVAYDLAPAIRVIFDRAGLVPADLKACRTFRGCRLQGSDA
jgi:hypothetical protein